MTSLLTVAAIATTCSFAVAQTPRAMFLLDRSGSMLVSVGGTTRWEKSEHHAKLDVASFFASHPTGEVQIREFLNDGATIEESRVVSYVPSSGGVSLDWISAVTIPSGWTPTAYAQATVEASTDILGGYTTPLAEAICQTMTELLVHQAVAGPSAEVFIHVYSDGGENSSSGACSGASACNALTGRCDFDTHHSGAPYTSPCGSLDPSWQQNACGSMNAVRAFCGDPVNACEFIFNVYKFNDFSTDSLNAGFAFLDSAARGTGGLIVEIDDDAPLPATSAYAVRPVGCSDAQGFEPLVQANALPRLGSTVDVEVSAGNYLELLLLGFAEADPGIPLVALGSPDCVLGVQAVLIEPLLLTQGNYALPIPQNQALLGTEIVMQGAGHDLFNVLVPKVITSNVLVATIVP